MAKCIAVVCNFGFTPTAEEVIVKYLIKYRDGSTTPAIFGMNVFVTIVYGYQPLVIVTKISILDVSRVLDLPLKCNDLTN